MMPRSRVGISGISPDHRLHADPEQRAGVLNETLAADAVIVAAAGQLARDLQRVWRNRPPNTYHGVRLPCMGYEVNAALG